MQPKLQVSGRRCSSTMTALWSWYDCAFMEGVTEEGGTPAKTASKACLPSSAFMATRGIPVVRAVGRVRRRLGTRGIVRCRGEHCLRQQRSHARRWKARPTTPDPTASRRRHDSETNGPRETPKTPTTLHHSTDRRPRGTPQCDNKWTTGNTREHSSAGLSNPRPHHRVT